MGRYTDCSRCGVSYEDCTRKWFFVDAIACCPDCTAATYTDQGPLPHLGLHREEKDAKVSSDRV